MKDDGGRRSRSGLASGLAGYFALIAVVSLALAIFAATRGMLPVTLILLVAAAAGGFFWWYYRRKSRQN